MLLDDPQRSHELQRAGIRVRGLLNGGDKCKYYNRGSE
jgi:hypothetical protein